jgi:hypothetical protein
MVRGLYEIRNEAQNKLQEMITHARDNQMLELSKWHAYYVVRDKKLIALDEYSLKTLKDFTTEDWRRIYAQDWVEKKEIKIDFFG